MKLNFSAHVYQNFSTLECTNSFFCSSYVPFFFTFYSPFFLLWFLAKGSLTDTGLIPNNVNNFLSSSTTRRSIERRCPDGRRRPSTWLLRDSRNVEACLEKKLLISNLGMVAQLRLSNPHVFLSVAVWKTRPRGSRAPTFRVSSLSFAASFLFFPLPPSPLFPLLPSISLSPVFRLFLSPSPLCSFSPLFSPPDEETTFFSSRFPLPLLAKGSSSLSLSLFLCSAVASANDLFAVDCADLLSKSTLARFQDCATRISGTRISIALPGYLGVSW